MNPIPLNPDTENVARRVVWFESPAQALADPVRFMAYAMSYARHEDMKVLRRYVSDEDFLEALQHAPPGIIDPRSWAYWNSKFGRYPTPPLLLREFYEECRESGHLFSWVRVPLNSNLLLKTVPQHGSVPITVAQTKQGGECVGSLV